MIPAPLLAMIRNPCFALCAVLVVVVVGYQFRLVSAQHDVDQAALQIAALKADIAGYAIAVERQAALTRDMAKATEHADTVARLAAKSKLAERRAIPRPKTITSEVLTEWVRVLASDL